MGAVAAAAMGLGNSEKILFGAGRRLMSRGIPAFEFGGFVRDARARLGALDGGEQVFNQCPVIHAPSSPWLGGSSPVDFVANAALKGRSSTVLLTFRSRAVPNPKLPGASSLEHAGPCLHSTRSPAQPD